MTARTARRAVRTLLLGPRPRPHDFLPPLWGSGGHFNPAVSLAAALIGGLDLTMLLPYWASQLCGGLVGAALAKVGDPGGWAAAGLHARPARSRGTCKGPSAHSTPAPLCPCLDGAFLGQTGRRRSGPRALFPRVRSRLWLGSASPSPGGSPILQAPR